MIFNSAQTPILITCRDRVSELRQLVTWLELAGHERIILVDNDSTFPPLLVYYETTPHQVIRLGRNLGHLAAWEGSVLDSIAWRGPYVVTDCDVVPDPRTPLDAVERFAELLLRYSDVDKVGFGLVIDDLPPTYHLRDDVLAWEAQFWEDEAEPGVFRAPIDTTFALYRPTAPKGTYRALRTGPPYVARHLPWYIDSAHLSDEETYYRQHMMPGVSNWNLDQLPDDLRAAIDARRPAAASPDNSATVADDPDPTIVIRVPGLDSDIRFVRTDQRGGFWDLFSAGQWEPETIALIVELAGPGTTFVDIGAWTGPLALIAAKCGARVIAFEPDPVALSVLRSNLALNSDVEPMITVVPKALAARAGRFFMASTQLGDSMSSIAHAGPETTSVEAIDAAAWSSSPDFLSADVLKIDIEGAEFLVLPCLSRAFKVKRPVMLLSVHGYHLVERFPRLPKRARWAVQHVISLIGRARILRATRRYRERLQWNRSLRRWQALTGRNRRRFLLSMADTELVLSDAPILGTTSER